MAIGSVDVFVMRYKMLHIDVDSIEIHARFAANPDSIYGNKQTNI